MFNMIFLDIVVVFGPEHLRRTLSSYIVTLNYLDLHYYPESLEVIFGLELSFDSHIKKVCTTTFFHVHSIAKIINILSQSDAEKLLHAFVTSRLVFCVGL